MQDRESQSDVNPGIVEQGLDDAGVEREGMQGSSGDVEREGLRGGPATEREAFGEQGQAGREDAMSPDGGSSR